MKKNKEETRKKMLKTVSKGIRFLMSRRLKEQEKSNNISECKSTKEVATKKEIIIVTEKKIPDYNYVYDGVTGWSKRPNGNHLVP